MTREIFDVIIIGSGIVGATAALALAKNTTLNIAVLESNTAAKEWQKNSYDFRVSAMSLASRRIFHHINVWDSIQSKRISPYQHMHVWDAGGKGEIQFDCAALNEAALGFIIEDSVMRTSLLEKFHDYSHLQFIHPIKLISLNHQANYQTDYVELIAEDNTIFKTKLVIAADGANSWVREQAGIQLKSWDYAQTAIVTTVKTTLPHEKTAWQRFLPTGPLAFLPLQDSHTCSIVWSEIHSYADELLALDDANFKQRLTNAFGSKLGDITDVSQRYHFPLRMRHAKNYVQNRIALIGDAAHTIHPLAGQGVNLGLLDAACLVEVITDAVKKSRDFSHLATLRRYERWRKSDNLAMLASVDVLKYLFTNDNKMLQNMRNTGLSLTNNLSVIKNYMANYALGNRSDLPMMASSLL